MKKVSTEAAKQSRKISEQKLTVGLDLGDRSSWYCVLDEAGAILLEQRLSTTPEGHEGSVRRRYRAAGSLWKQACIRPG